MLIEIRLIPSQCSSDSCVMWRRPHHSPLTARGELGGELAGGGGGSWGGGGGIIVDADYFARMIF